MSLENESGSVALDHQHEVIDFIDVIFNAASNESDNHQGESSVFEIKIKEHIGSGKYTFLLKNPEYKVSHVFWEVFQYSNGGFISVPFVVPLIPPIQNDFPASGPVTHFQVPSFSASLPPIQPCPGA